jgi:hypothetical protein
MSALPPKADIVQHGGNVRFVPKAAIAGERIGRFSRAAGRTCLVHWQPCLGVSMIQLYVRFTSPEQTLDLH